MPAGGVSRGSSRGQSNYQRALGYTPIVENNVIVGYTIFDQGSILASIVVNPTYNVMVNDEYRKAIMECIYDFWHKMGLYQ